MQFTQVSAQAIQTMFMRQHLCSMYICCRLEITSSSEKKEPRQPFSCDSLYTFPPAPLCVQTTQVMNIMIIKPSHSIPLWSETVWCSSPKTATNKFHGKQIIRLSFERKGAECLIMCVYCMFYVVCCIVCARYPVSGIFYVCVIIFLGSVDLGELNRVCVSFRIHLVLFILVLNKRIGCYILFDRQRERETESGRESLTFSISFVTYYLVFAVVELESSD